MSHDETDIYNHLQSIRHLINATGVGRAAGIPRNTLGKHFRWQDNKKHGVPLHEKYFDAVLGALKKIRFASTE